jgi:serine/threonine protein kinase
MALLEPGTKIRDTYEVERFLGEGAFAEVYRVKHRFLGRQAMKLFKLPGMQISEIEEMMGEAIILSKIGHPNIIRVFDANVIEIKGANHGYFTMENVAGGSLERFWHSYGFELVPVETSTNIVSQVCRGLCLAHDESPPMIHRDIKPQNILVGYDGSGLRARLSDFGLAKSVNPLTLLATGAGTLAFKPPEVFTMDRGDSPAADMWAIGVTLYWLLTDEMPYYVDPTLGWNQKDLQGVPKTPSSVNPDANLALDRIVAKALARDPESRYQTAREMLKDLEAWDPKPDAFPTTTSTEVSHSKTSLSSDLSSSNPEKGKRLAEEAMLLKNRGRLAEAADLMEEAFNEWPELRPRFGSHVGLWRNGISM